MAINFICWNQFSSYIHIFCFAFVLIVVHVIVNCRFFCCCFAAINFSLASGARIFIEHAAYFLTDIEAVVVKNTHTYRMIVNLTKFKRKKEMKCERLLLDSKVQNIKEKRRKSLWFVHDFSRCKCFGNFRFDKFKNLAHFRFRRVELNISKWEDDRIKWEVVANVCPLMNKTQVNFVRGPIVQQENLQKPFWISIYDERNQTNKILINSI